MVYNLLEEMEIVMLKSFVTLMLVVGLLVGTSGCAVFTEGSGNWEAYCGVRTEQTSDESVSVGIESPVIERLIDNLTDGEATEAE